MINQVSRHQRDVPGQGQGTINITLDNNLSRPVVNHKKDHSDSKCSIQSKLTKFYFEDLSKIHKLLDEKDVSRDSLLVGLNKTKTRIYY